MIGLTEPWPQFIRLVDGCSKEWFLSAQTYVRSCNVCYSISHLFSRMWVFRILLVRFRLLHIFWAGHHLSFSPCFPPHVPQYFFVRRLRVFVYNYFAENIDYIQLLNVIEKRTWLFNFQIFSHVIFNHSIVFLFNPLFLAIILQQHHDQNSEISLIWFN